MRPPAASTDEQPPVVEEEHPCGHGAGRHQPEAAAGPARAAPPSPARSPARARSSSAAAGPCRPAPAGGPPPGPRGAGPSRGGARAARPPAPGRAAWPPSRPSPLADRHLQDPGGHEALPELGIVPGVLRGPHLLGGGLLGVERREGVDELLLLGGGFRSMALPSHHPRGAALPVALAQARLVELAVVEAGQLRHEVVAARPLVAGQALLAPGPELGLELLAGVARPRAAAPRPSPPRPCRRWAPRTPRRRAPSGGPPARPRSPGGRC